MNNTKVDFKNVLAGIGIGVVVLFLIFLAADRNGSITASLLNVETSELVNNDVAEGGDLVYSLIRVMKQDTTIKNGKDNFSFQYYSYKTPEPRISPLPFTLKDTEVGVDYKSSSGYEKLFNNGKDGWIYSIPLISGDGNTYVIEEVEKAPPSLSKYDTTYSCFVLGADGKERNHFSGKGTKITLTPEQILGFKLTTIPKDPIGEILVCTFKNTKRIPQSKSKTLEQ